MQESNVPAAAVPARCDLHTHSVFSDGTYTPAQLVAEAKRLGLIVALTDHNTLAGLPEFTDAARKAGVTALPGIEFSTEYGGREMHLLGLFVMPEHYDAVERLLAEERRFKDESNIRLIENLVRGGYEISYENVKPRARGGIPNRVHVAQELIEKGYVVSVAEAFNTLLRDNGEFCRSGKHLPLIEVITVLRQIGVLPVLAHPLQDVTERDLAALLPRAIEAGLMGIETAHSSYAEQTARLAEEIAARFALLPCGGSDFHGSVKPDVPLGQPRVPAEVYFALLRAWEGIRPAR